MTTEDRERLIQIADEIQAIRTKYELMPDGLEPGLRVHLVQAAQTLRMASNWKTRKDNPS